MKCQIAADIEKSGDAQGSTADPDLLDTGGVDQVVTEGVGKTANVQCLIATREETCGTFSPKDCR